MAGQSVCGGEYRGWGQEGDWREGGKGPGHEGLTLSASRAIGDHGTDVDMTWLDVYKDHFLVLLKTDVGDAGKQRARMKGGG